MYQSDKIFGKVLETNGLTLDDLQPRAAATNAELEAALRELDKDYTARLAEIENALCDIDGGMK